MSCLSHMLLDDVVSGVLSGVMFVWCDDVDGCHVRLLAMMLDMPSIGCEVGCDVGRVAVVVMQPPGSAADTGPTAAVPTVLCRRVGPGVSMCTQYPCLGQIHPPPPRRLHPHCPLPLGLIGCRRQLAVLAVSFFCRVTEVGLQLRQLISARCMAMAFAVSLTLLSFSDGAKVLNELAKGIPVW